jgi:hypothetical protein
LRERAALGTRISSFDIAITWVTRRDSASCVTRSRFYLLSIAGDTAVGSSIASCASQEQITAGMKPTRP